MPDTKPCCSIRCTKAEHFESDAAFLEFIRYARRNALYDTGVTVGAEDSILTLITCDRSYGGKAGRLAVVAVLEKSRRNL